MCFFKPEPFFDHKMYYYSFIIDRTVSNLYNKFVKK